jgi:hypothetical protein
VGWLAKLTRETSLKQVKAMILDTFSGQDFVRQLKGLDETEKLTLLCPIKR